MKFQILSSVMLGMTLTACSLTPQLTMPVAPIPKHYPAVNLGDQRAGIVPLDWTNVFTDPYLQQLIPQALENNRDLRLATLDVAVVQAQYGIQRSTMLPAIDVAISETRQRSNSSGTGATVSAQKNISLGISAYEIDLFSRASSMTDAAFARFLSSEYGRNSAQISLVSAIADAYHAVLLARDQLQLAKQTLKDWQQSLNLARQLKEAKQNSGLDVAQAEGQVAIAEADCESRTRALALAHHALQLLVGKELTREMDSAPKLEQLPRPFFPTGLPSDLLTNRPDILQAEQNLRAANADIGAARAAFFPRLSLTTSVGYGSSEMHNLFDRDNRSWIFAPQITIPIFSAGRLRAELRLSELRKSIAVVEYERAIQIAFREVSDGLVGRETFTRQFAAQQRVVDNAAKRLELSTLRYRAGVDSRLEVLDAQRQLYAAQQALLDLRGAELSNAVSLYKALGGGAVPSLRSQLE
ncbi:efflux transporter outer membrane subunit [Leeia sp. TBRC 13508]|uniref:Efflux transporter outer membrane subunit n=1 Tax=Leeia speluncae TaxID=2884804 RepID=A0ABS8D7U7_9NEIS|nr:efflux transporter outer membrane subunit [Leeia speluncae]MCB6184197.1 efflux transporter outer membrane subunit [Leeia speluncae]